jgi:hypothetical protein
MPSTNLYFNNFDFSQEQELIEDLIIETIKVYGIECYYLPRTLVAEDELFGEDALAKFEFAYPLEMYIKSVDGFQGDGDFLSKFGLEIRDSMVLTVARRRFEEEIHISDSTPVNEEQGIGRPSEGDLVYFPLNGKIFEVKFVEHEAVFYQMGKLQTYDLSLELFEYSHETIDTGVDVIDAIEDEHSISYTYIKLENSLPFATAVATVTGQFVTSVSITDGGIYETAGFTPTVTFSDPPASVNAIASIVISNGAIQSTPITENGRGYVNPVTVTFDGRQLIEGYAISNKKFGNYSYKLGVESTDTLFTRHQSESEGIFNFHINVPSGSNTVYGRVLQIEDTTPDYIVEVTDEDTTSFNLLVTGSQTLYANNLLKDSWHFVSIKREDDAGTTRTTLFHQGNQVATLRDAGEPSSIYERVINVKNTRSGNVYIDHVFLDSDPTATPTTYSNTLTSNTGTVTLLLDFEDAPSDPFLVFSNANIDSNGSVTSVNIPTISGGEILSSNILIQEAPESFPAQGTATVSNNQVVTITITNQGQGYVSAPTIAITSDELSGRVLLEDLTTLVDDSNRYANNDPQANNTLFQNDLNFIDFSEFNPFSEGDRW